MNKGIKIGLQVVLISAIFFLGYALLKSISKPIFFNKKYEARYNVVKEKMMKIRDAEVAYQETYGKYTNNFDTLVDFIKNDSLILIKAEGSVPDSIYTKANSKLAAELRALELGLISRDTIKVSVIDSLFHNTYDIDTLKYIPFSDKGKVFQLNADIIKTLSKVEMPVFELIAHNNSYLNGLDEQLIINKNDAARDNDKFPGLIVGSLLEVSINGNWD